MELSGAGIRRSHGPVILPAEDVQKKFSTEFSTVENAPWGQRGKRKIPRKYPGETAPAKRDTDLLFQESEALYDSRILRLAAAYLEERDDFQDEDDGESYTAGNPSEERDDESDAADN